MTYVGGWVWVLFLVTVWVAGTSEFDLHKSSGKEVKVRVCKLVYVGK